jgi:hypothetical protein
MVRQVDLLPLLLLVVVLVHLVVPALHLGWVEARHAQ